MSTIEDRATDQEFGSVRLEAAGAVETSKKAMSLMQMASIFL